METTFNNSERMRKYFEKEITNVVKVTMGLVAFYKPSIKRHFCFSYDEVMDCHCGTNTYQEAVDSCRNMQVTTFINENLEELNRKLEMLQEEKIYFIKGYNRNNLSIKFVSEGYKERFPFDIIGEATEEDVEVLKVAVQQEIEKFTKRLQTYLKRYGLSKLRTWTYSIND